MKKIYKAPQLEWVDMNRNEHIAKSGKIHVCTGRWSANNKKINYNNNPI